MGPKQFLLQECENVGQLLNSTLKHEYGLDGSRDFFDECSDRLEIITLMLKATPDDGHEQLSIYGIELNELSKLICRIERSSLGEYSWPFVEELKEIAQSICTEKFKGVDTPHKVYVLADGGLAAYRIFVERKRTSCSKRLILSIVFPKTLKDFVLLHSILGHELGHAIYKCSKHQNFIDTRVIPVLQGKGVFSKSKATAAHLFSQQAPEAIKEFLKKYPGAKQHNFESWAVWNAWVEEIFCDLIGLLTFGPSFLAAQCKLLRGLAPSGFSIGQKHPPVSWRLNALIRCAEIEGFDEPPPVGHPLNATFVNFWNETKKARNADPWHNVFSDAELAGAVSALKQMLAPFPPSGYPDPDRDQLCDLVAKLKSRIPPVGFKAKGPELIALDQVDFRHILYAGWMVAELNEEKLPSFEEINRLCQHAIMQQRAIDIFTKRKTLEHGGSI